MLNIALPKGRLGNKVYDLFERIDCGCEGILDESSRRLVFENPENGVRYFLVKPMDVATYVERGTADIGVAGKDVLLEKNPDLYELMDLKLGKCKIAVAGMRGYREDRDSALRVATKYANVARDYYKRLNREIEIIELNGSIELAPILGLSDVILDIVETGSTLKENDLCIYEEAIPYISARLIANKRSYRFKQGQISSLMEKLAEVLP